MSRGLAFGAAVAGAFGAGDFFQGLGVRRATVLAVMVWGQGGALVVLAAFALVTRSAVTASAAPLGIGVGFAAAAGTSLLLLGFARGRVSIVSPAASLAAVGIPLTIDAVTGTIPSALHYVGLALALAAIMLIAHSSPPHEDPNDGVNSSRVYSGGLLYGLAAGAAHGVMYVLLDQTRTGNTVPTLVIAYVVLVATGILAARVTRTTLRLAPRHAPVVLAAGLLGAAGTGLFVAAAAVGAVGTAAVVAETSPALTALLARIFLRENIPPLRAAGIVLAVSAVVLLST